MSSQVCGRRPLCFTHWGCKRWRKCLHVNWKFQRGPYGPLSGVRHLHGVLKRRPHWSPIQGSAHSTRLVCDVTHSCTSFSHQYVPPDGAIEHHCGVDAVLHSATQMGPDLRPYLSAQTGHINQSRGWPRDREVETTWANNLKAGEYRQLRIVNHLALFVVIYAALG